MPKKKKEEITIRSSESEYLTYIASEDSVIRKFRITTDDGMVYA